MDIDELPEDIAATCRRAAQAMGMDVDDPNELKQIMAFIMMMNAEKLSEREGVDREAGDWDSDDDADNDNPAFERNRDVYRRTKSATASVVKILDRAYAMKGRGDAIVDMEERLHNLQRKEAPEEMEEPLSMKQAFKDVRDNVAPSLLFSSFRRSRINDLQLAYFAKLYQEDIRKQQAGEPSSSDRNADATLTVHLMHGPAGLSDGQLQHAHGAFLRVNNVRRPPSLAAWSPRDEDWSPLEAALRTELDRPRALPPAERPPDSGRSSSQFARFDPLSLKTHYRARNAGDPDRFPDDPLVGVARSVGCAQVREFGNLLQEAEEERPWALAVDGDLAVAACITGYKGRSAAATWWRLNDSVGRGRMPRHRTVRDRLTAAGLEAITCHAASETLWLGASGRAFGVVAGASQSGYSLQLPAARCDMLCVTDGCVLALSGGNRLSSWGLDRLTRLGSGLGEAAEGGEDPYDDDDPCADEMGSREDALDAVPDGEAPNATQTLPFKASCAQALAASSGQPRMMAVGFGRRAGGEHGGLSQYAERSSSVLLYDVGAGQLSARLLGHSTPASLSSQAHAPANSLASFSVRDGVVNVWDVRNGRPSHTITTSDDRVLHTALLVEAGGVPFLFTGGSDEAIKAWDLRRGGRPLYELTSGNTTVCALEWHAPSASLLAATQSSYLTERAFGRVDGYGWDYDLTSFIEGMRGRSLRDAMLHQKLMQEDCRRLTATRARLPTSDEWPVRAMHAPGDFPVGAQLDVHGHAVLRYRFDTSGAPTAQPETTPETASERAGGKRRKAGPGGRGKKSSSSASGSGSRAEDVGAGAQYLY